MMASVALKTISLLLTMATLTNTQSLINDYNLISGPPQAYNSFSGVGIIPAAPQYQQQQQLSHSAVVENAIAESQLPSELLNSFYKNPAIANALAKESWFHNKEFPVHHREAEKIPRSKIYEIVSRLQSRRR